MKESEREKRERQRERERERDRETIITLRMSWSTISLDTPGSSKLNASCQKNNQNLYLMFFPPTGLKRGGRSVDKREKKMILKELFRNNLGSKNSLDHSE